MIQKGPLIGPTLSTPDQTHPPVGCQVVREQSAYARALRVPETGRAPQASAGHAENLIAHGDYTDPCPVPDRSALIAVPGLFAPADAGCALTGIPLESAIDPLQTFKANHGHAGMPAGDRVPPQLPFEISENR